MTTEPRSSTETLINAMHILARDIQSGDGVANAAIAEAAERLREQDARVERLYHKLALLQETQSRMRDPERRMVCDILANGSLWHDPDGSRYAVPEDAEADRDAAREEAERLRDAAIRVIEMCGEPTIDRCYCGRPTGLNALVSCLQTALAPPEEKGNILGATLIMLKHWAIARLMKQQPPDEKGEEDEKR